MERLTMNPKVFTGEDMEGEEYNITILTKSNESLPIEADGSFMVKYSVEDKVRTFINPILNFLINKFNLELNKTIGNIQHYKSADESTILIYDTSVTIPEHVNVRLSGEIVKACSGKLSYDKVKETFPQSVS